MPKDGFIRLEVDDIKMKMQSGSVIESDFIQHKGLNWSIQVFRENQNGQGVCFGVKCSKPENAESWSCNVFAELRVLNFCYDDWADDFNENFNDGNAESAFVFEKWSMMLNPQRGYIRNGIVIFEATISLSNVNIKYSPLNVVFFNKNDYNEHIPLQCSRNKDYDSLLAQISNELKWDPLEIQLYDSNGAFCGKLIQPGRYSTLKNLLSNQNNYGGFYQLFFEKMKRVPVLNMVDKQTQTLTIQPALPTPVLQHRNCDYKIDVYLTECNKDQITFIEAFLNWSYGQFAETVGKTLHCDAYSVQFYCDKNGVVGEPLYPNLKTTFASMAGISENSFKPTCSFFYSKIKEAKKDHYAVTCPICLDGHEMITLERRSWYSTKCGHIFCQGCIEKAHKKHGQCPKCRTALSMNDFHPIFL